MVYLVFFFELIDLLELQRGRLLPEPWPAHLVVDLGVFLLEFQDIGAHLLFFLLVELVLRVLGAVGEGTDDAVAPGDGKLEQVSEFGFDGCFVFQLLVLPGLVLLLEIEDDHVVLVHLQVADEGVLVEDLPVN